MLKKLIALFVLIIFILFEFCGVYSYALTPYEGTVENPVLQEVTTDSITLVPFEGYEYSKDGMIWQDSNVFNNLTVATTYEMYQRVKATDEVDKSPKSDMLEVTTKKYENNSIPSIPMLSNRTDTLINLVIFSGYEYSIDGENFQDSSTFTNLIPNTKYTFYQRIKETSDTYASKISNPENIYTLKKNNTTEPEEIQTEEITATSVTLVVIEGYEYSIDGTSFQDNNVFDGLTPNTEYTFYQRTKETDEYLAGSISNKTIKTIKYTNNNSVDAPVLQSYTANDVTLKKLDILEYSKDQENWQDSNIFNDLTPETDYVFYQRIKETNDTYASNSSEGLSIRTKKENTNIPVKPEIADVTENIVTLKNVEGYEYSIDEGATWQESNVFTKLEPLTEYTFVQRIKTDNQYGYSVISEASEIVWTEQILTNINLPDDYIPIYTEEDIPKGLWSWTPEEHEEAVMKLKSNYILMNDIELEKIYIRNIMDNSTEFPFEGVFNGNGYSLKSKNPLVCINRGIIKNLNINLKYDETVSAYTIAEYNYGQIINCHTRGELYGNGNGVAGIAWENNGIIKYCNNEAVLRQNTGTTSSGYVSGICHVNKGTIEACVNNGVLINDNSGTIAGISIQNFGIIKNCYNNAKMGPGHYASGIVDENFENGIIKSCYNVGDIFLEDVVTNPFYGYREVTLASGLCKYNNGIIDCCYNAGNITSGESFGLVWQNSNKLSNCYNQGKITSLYGTENSGRGNCSGLINNNYSGTIDNCYNIGVINAHEFANSANIANGNSGSISGCYYLKNDSSNDNYGEGLSFVEMQQQESFEGFDFDTIWQIDPNADYYFPTLRGIENKTILPKKVETELITTNSITIKNIEGYEYSIDGENYQDSNMFENLTSSTEYTIYQRIKKTETTDESIAAYTLVKTLTYIGDINGDGKVNITDVALINAHVKKTKLLAGEELEKADINGDGKVNITDVALVNAHVKKVKLLF